MELVKQVFKERGGKDLIVVDPKEYSDISPPLNGDHQRVLTGIALKVIEFFRSSDECMQFVIETKLPGRLERRWDIPRVRFPVILDGAHNEESAVALRQFVDREARGRSVVWIIATSVGREAVVIPNLVRAEDSAIFIKFKSHDTASWIQCASPHELAAISSTMACQTIDAFVDEAIASIGDINNRKQLVVVAGSLYLVRNYLRFISSGVV
jgi:folylpolyglutamate synthase/dihydropteroate synthase